MVVFPLSRYNKHKINLCTEGLIFPHFLLCKDLGNKCNVAAGGVLPLGLGSSEFLAIVLASICPAVFLVVFW